MARASQSCCVIVVHARFCSSDTGVSADDMGGVKCMSPKPPSSKLGHRFVRGRDPVSQVGTSISNVEVLLLIDSPTSGLNVLGWFAVAAAFSRSHAIRRARDGFPYLRDTLYVHEKPLLVQREQIGWALSHFIFAAEQASQERRRRGRVVPVFIFQCQQAKSII